MLNFDWYALQWYFVWCDSRYDHWGSPTCPQEQHSHRKNGRHFVDYGNHTWEECLDCDEFMFSHQLGEGHMRCTTCNKAKDE